MVIALALGAMVLWAVTMVLAKPGLARMDAIAYGFIRPIFASLLILPYALLTPSLVFPSVGTVAIAVLGGFVDMFVGVALFMYGIKRISAHEVGTLSNTAPFWGVLVAVIWLREKPEPMTFAAAALVVAGAYFLASHRKSQHEHSSLLGALAALGAGISWGVADTAMAKYCLTHGMPRPTLHLIYMLSAGTCWGILATLKGRFSRKYYPWNGVKIALLTALTGMFAGMLLWFIALERAPASVLSPTRGALTLFVFILSVLVLREKPSRRSGLGVALVAAGVAIVSFLA